MELDRIYPLTTRVEQRLHCSQQMAKVKPTLFIHYMVAPQGTTSMK